LTKIQFKLIEEVKNFNEDTFLMNELIFYAKMVNKRFNKRLLAILNK